MVLHIAIALFSGWLSWFQPADLHGSAPFEITGIQIVGDTCNLSADISFQVSGSSNSTYFFWEFDDPASGERDTITIEGNRGLGNTSHQFSAPGVYEVHVSFQEPGSPVTRICKKVSIGQCCPGANSSLTTVKLCADELPYSWNGNVYQSPGNYQMAFTNAAGCDSMASLALQISTAAPNLGNDTTLCPGEKLVLDAGDFKNYEWHDLSTAREFQVNQSGRYSVTVTNGEGCSASDAIQVNYAANCGDIFFPSAITPNNDGKNDVFRALGNVSSVSDYNLVIYNRFGQVVFNSKNPLQQWDGWLKGAPSANANFVWNAAYSINGRPKKQKKGSFVMLR